MIEALQAGLTASALFLFAVVFVALVAFAAAPVMKEAWIKWRKRGKLDKVVSLVAVGIAIAYGGSKSHDVPNAGADDGIALVGISAEYDSTNDVTAVNVKYTAGDVTVSTPVSVRNAESEQWRALEKIDATVTTGQTNVLAFAVAGNAATNRYWWVGVDTPAVIIESQGITITNYVATSKSVRIDWTCDDPKATVFAVQRKRTKPAGVPYDAEVEYLESINRQYIKTGVLFDGMTDVIECEFAIVEAKQYGTVFGANSRATGTELRFTFRQNNVNGTWQTQGCTFQSSVPYTAGGFYKIRVASQANGGSFINGTSGYLSAPKVYRFAGNVLYIFAVDDFAGQANWFSAARLYGFKITRSGIPILDLIPVRVGSIGYLYDRVSKSLFGNAGTGAFAYGSDTLSYDWETVDTTSANTYTFSGFTIGEDWEWRIMSTYTEGDE